MDDTLATFFRVVLLAVAALVPIINPPGIAPIFLSMTPGMSEPMRTSLARRIARHSFVLLSAAMLIGSYVLMVFGLSLAVVKMAGGLLVIATAWHLNRAERSPDSTIVAASPAKSAEQIWSSSFYPLTFPVTIGPGSISVAVTLGAGIRVRNVADVTSVLAALIGIALVSSAVYLCYRYAARLLQVLGPTGRVVVLRLSAFILLAVGVQVLCDGLVERFGISTLTTQNRYTTLPE